MSEREIAHDVAAALAHLLAEVAASCPLLTTAEAYQLFYPPAREAVAAALALSRGEKVPPEEPAP